MDSLAILSVGFNILPRPTNDLKVVNTRSVIAVMNVLPNCRIIILIIIGKIITCQDRNPQVLIRTYNKVTFGFTNIGISANTTRIFIKHQGIQLLHNNVLKREPAFKAIR